jgi:hypothetical protein
MNLFQPISIAAACVLALSACASAPPAYRAPQASAPAAVAKAPAASGSLIQPVSAYGAANTGGTYPYGTDQTGAETVTQQTAQAFSLSAPQQAPQQANAETTEGVVVMGPDGAVWSHAGGQNTAYQGDVDSCYAYARGQVAHDVRIESDVASAFDSDSGGFGLAALRGRMNDFERTNRVPALFNSCMTVKGYNRQ